jgi:hypothetical protein
MKWLDTDRIYQRTAEGEAKANAYFYVYRVAQSFWVAGRFWFGQEIDFRIKFESAELAREYCEMKDREAVVIEEVRA